MIDIHSHILPLVDDGASSVDMALQLLDEAYRDGTDAIILTPHLAYAYGFVNPKEFIKDYFHDLKRIVKDVGIPIDIYLGCEFLYTSKDSFHKHLEDITTLNDTKYLLMEFFFDVEEDEVIEAVDSVLEKGFIPVIAHPERFDAFRSSFTLAKQVVHKGALLQMNKGSILGRYGRSVKQCVMELLDKKYISFVGSDAHNPQTRSSLMYDAYEYMKVLYDEDYVEDIFYHNPLSLLKGIDIRKKGKHEKD